MRLLLSIFDNPATLQQPSQRCQGLIESFYHLLTISRSIKALLLFIRFFFNPKHRKLCDGFTIPPDGIRDTNLHITDLTQMKLPF
jgi:hypothetical protein